MDSTLMGILAICAVMVIVAAWGLMHIVEVEDRIGARLRGTTTRTARRKFDTKTLLEPLAQIVGGIGGLIARSGLLSRSTVKEFEQTLAGSGVSPRNSLGLFVGIKILLMFGLPAAAFLLSSGLGMDGDTGNTIALIGGIAGLLGPDMTLRRLRARYIAKVEGGIADMLDLLLICAQSGLALQPGLVRVEVEIRGMYPELAWEVAQTATELQINADSRVALNNLGTRTGIDSLRRLTGTLVQTLQYGTPLSEALRALSHEMRQETLTRFEEKAARLPILLTMPMIIFILPCVFIIVGGPAVIQLIHNFG
jgi:tight adherence protein C